MRVLLASLNSKYVHSNLALKYLYTVVEKNQSFVEIRDFTINNDDDYIFTEILAGGYDVICFSCYVWNIEETAHLAENIKKAAPNVIIVFGGPETSYETAEFMKQNKAVDIVIIGEGEYTFTRLLDALNLGDTQYENIKGLAFRRGNEIFVNQQPELLAFESIPFPYKLLSCEEDKIIYFQSSRGCPFSCTYCISSLEKKLRALPINRALKDIEYFLVNNVKQVKFVDRTFNWDNSRCNAILNYIIDNDNGVTSFHFEICGELITDEFVKIISRARKGLLRFEIGIQTTNKKALSVVRRSVRVKENLEKTLKITALPNIHVHVDLIVGLPFDDYYSVQNSFDDAYCLAADTLQLGFLKLLKGTELRDNAELYGYKYRSKAPYEIISSKFLNAQDLRRFKQVEKVLNLYYNRGGFERALDYATSVFAETPFEFYEEFSMFFHLKGFQHKSHKKEDLYRILYDYAEWKTKKIKIPSEEFVSLLAEDIRGTLNVDAIKKMERKGWALQ